MNTVVGFKVTHYMNTQHTQAIRSVIFKRYKSRIYWPTRKIKIAEDDPEDDGTKEEEEVYGGEVEDKEHEHDEYEAHKPARVYDEPLKIGRAQLIETLQYFLENTQNTGAKYSNVATKVGK